MKYYYSVNGGTPEGPFNEKELQDLATSGIFVISQTKVAEEGTENWIALGDFFQSRGQVKFRFVAFIWIVFA